MKILVIEDEALLLKAIERKLKTEGLEVEACSGGEEAFVKLSKGFLPDLIWLDYYLKDIDGMEVVTRLKEKNEWAKIPVMVVSNSASSDKVHNMLALGVEKYVLKADYRLEELIEMIKDLVGKKNNGKNISG